MRSRLGTYEDWRYFVKPWLTPKAWQKQIGPALALPSTQEVLAAVSDLQQQGSLLRLLQPGVNAAKPKPGRPTKKVCMFQVHSVDSAGSWLIMVHVAGSKFTM